VYEQPGVRAEIVAFAEETYLAQWRTYKGLKAADRKYKQPPSWDQCLQMSRDIRRKRERDQTWYNDLIAAT
jgi:hypothetical protein